MSLIVIAEPAAPWLAPTKPSGFVSAAGTRQPAWSAYPGRRLHGTQAFTHEKAAIEYLEALGGGLLTVWERRWDYQPTEMDTLHFMHRAVIPGFSAPTPSPALTSPAPPPHAS